MSDAKKTHTLTLGKHSEEVTEGELAAAKKALGRRFAEYTLSPIQPPKPPDVAPTSAKLTTKNVPDPTLPG